MKYFLTLSILLALVASVCEADNVVAPAARRFTDPASQDVPDFQKHVVPLLGRLGCNSAKCHGSFQGQGDLRLSLFGFDFASDHRSLNGEASSETGTRLSVQHPERSLILRKPTAQVDHEGGKRFAPGSWEHQLLIRWIEAGAKGPPRPTVAQEPPADISAADRKFFRGSVQPILEDHCFECHGFGASKGNFSLSTKAALLQGGDSGPAVVPGKPEKSLLVKAVRYSDEHLQMPPSGKLPDQHIATLKQWIAKGVPWPAGSAAPQETGATLTRLEYEPAEILFHSAGQTQQLRVIAVWQDGTREDVTCLTRFQTNNDAVVQVDRDGKASSTGSGDTHIIARYDNGVAAIPVLRPYPVAAESPPAESPQPTVASPHPIDQRVNAKLAKLALTPSDICSDSEYLRRVSIDMTGTLPTPEEVSTFLKDSRPDKRRRKVDELLQRPEYAAWWTNKLCDFTGCNPQSIRSLLEVALEEGYVKASSWYDWIYARVQRNQPYDELVAEMMLADLADPGDGMPYFWTRQSLKEPKDTAMSVAHAFLGIQLQCAECHKHPFDRWTQSDFNDFGRFFDSVTETKRRSASPKDQQLRLLRSRNIQLQAGDDPRKPLVDWMRAPDNPWFARAFVNRVWAGYFHVGIVEPPDQFTPANPPSNPQLLDWLADGFVANGYDMKWLHRQIATSETYQRSWKPNATNRNDRRNFSRAVPRRIPAEILYDAMKQATAADDKQRDVRSNLKRRAIGHLSMRMAGTHAMKVFGKPDRSINCDCERVNEPTLLQAIFTQNDPLVRMRIADSGWIIDIEDAQEASQPLNTNSLIDQVWLRTVSRHPDRAERKRALQHLQQSNTMAEGITDLLWAMMNTKEFLLNH